MTARTQVTWSAYATDVEAEITRIARFGIDTTFEGLANKIDSNGHDRRVVAHVIGYSDSDRWLVRLNPTASHGEQYEALSRIWEAVSHPDTHRWFTDYAPRTDGIYLYAVTASVQGFIDGLTERLNDIVTTEMGRIRTTMLNAAAGEYVKDFVTNVDGIGTWHFLTTHAEIVAGNVRAEMARQERTVAELAEVLNLTPATVRRRVKGLSEFRRDEFTALADWLELAPGDLLAVPYTGAGQPTNDSVGGEVACLVK